MAQPGSAHRSVDEVPGTNPGAPIDSRFVSRLDPRGGEGDTDLVSSGSPGQAAWSSWRADVVVVGAGLSGWRRHGHFTTTTTSRWWCSKLAAASAAACTPSRSSTAAVASTSVGSGSGRPCPSSRDWPKIWARTFAWVPRGHEHPQLRKPPGPRGRGLRVGRRHLPADHGGVRRLREVQGRLRGSREPSSARHALDLEQGRGVRRRQARPVA